MRPEKWGGGGKLYHEYTNLSQHRGLIKAQNRGLINWMQGNFIAQLNELGMLKRIKKTVKSVRKA